MIELKNIFPECNVDTFLVQLIFDWQIPGHRFGITEVAKALETHSGTDFVIGLIDTDKFKREPRFIKDFVEILHKALDDEGIIVQKIPGTNKHIIRLHPGFERWIWKAAATCGIDPRKYGFNEWKLLRAATKQQNVSENDKVAGFIKEVIEANPPAIQTLRHWLSKAV